MVKLILYDLDGTLIDSRRDIADAVNFTLQELGFQKLPIDRVSAFVGTGVKNLMRQALLTVGAGSRARSNEGPPRGVAPAVVEKSIKLFRRRYSEHLLDHTQLYPSVPKVLECLKNRKQAVVTNKPEDFSKTILKGLGIQPYFSEVIGGDAGFPKKPSPEPVLEVMRRAGTGPGESILVGDSSLDIETGHNAGIKTLAVTYGFGTVEEIQKAKPDFILNDLEELIQCPLLKR